MPTISATTASTVSNVPTVRAVRGAAAGLAAEGATGALAGAGAVGRATEVPGLAGAAGAAAAGAAAAVGAAAAGRGICCVAAVVTTGRGAPAGDAPVGGSEGSLIVGAAVGFGGKAMRTVSFLGCTLAASGGFGGTGGTGEFGVGSAIKSFVVRTYEAAKMVSNCYSPTPLHFTRSGRCWAGRCARPECEPSFRAF